MRLKKVLAVISATVLMATLSLPVFADDATAGEKSQGYAWELLAMTQNPDMDVAGAKEKMEQMTDEIKSDEATTVSAEMMTAALTFFDRMEDGYTADGKQENSDYKINVQDGTKNDVTYSCRSQENDTITVDNVSLDNGGTITFSAAATDSKLGILGYAITVDLPADATQTFYKFVQEDSNAQPIDAVVPVKSYLDKNNVTHKYVSFWVPHFTTYVLTPVSVSETTATTTTTSSTPSATAASTSQESIQYYTCPACGYHNWTATEDGYRCDNCGYVESLKQLSGYGNVKGVYTPKTGTENPIKATGSDMNMTVFVVVALIAAAACGMGITVSKSRKSE